MGKTRSQNSEIEVQGHILWTRTVKLAEGHMVTQTPREHSLLHISSMKVGGGFLFVI